MDPFHSFAAYPTQTLTEQTLLTLSDSDPKAALERALGYRGLAMVDFAKTVLPTEVEIDTVLRAAGSIPAQAEALVAEIPPHRKGFVLRSLVWLVKLGVLKVCR